LNVFVGYTIEHFAVSLLGLSRRAIYIKRLNSGTAPHDKAEQSAFSAPKIPISVHVKICQRAARRAYAPCDPAPDGAQIGDDAVNSRVIGSNLQGYQRNLP